MRKLLASLLGLPLGADSVEVLPEVAALPIASNMSTAELIEEIHHSFNSVGDRLLADAQATLAGADEASLAKGERLRAAGFVNTKQVKQTQQQAAKAAEARELQALILAYALRYPTNKFITRKHVDQIAAKYSLVVGDTSAYTGFVPDKNLREIEAFNARFQDADKPEEVIRINGWSHQTDSHLHKAIKQKYPDLCIPTSDPLLMLGRISPNYRINGDIAFFDKFERVNTAAQLICAPAADMDLSQLTQQNGHWFKAQQIHVPDPVVLQPVKGGYLILTAWGDEASDPLVLNEQLN